MVWSVLYIVVYCIVQHYIECMYVCIVGFKVGAGVLRAQVGVCNSQMVEQHLQSCSMLLSSNRSGAAACNTVATQYC